MKLIENHTSLYTVVPAKPSEAVRKAASVLVTYLEKVTGCRLPVCTDGAQGPYRIVLDILPFETPIEGSVKLGEEGFLFREQDGTVWIFAASEEALFFAVYDFLERYAGCLWLTSQDDYVPQRDTVEIGDGTRVLEVPYLNYREVYYRDAWDRTYSLKQKLNGQDSRVVDGKVREGHRNWGFWCHSFFSLIPPSVFFEEHPEYFALVDGKRIKDGQLCCTNDEMIGEAIRNLRKFVDARPDVRYWSVSQNDTAGYCTCEKCRKYDEEAGSPIGSILYFVNKVAEAFPDKMISTLSYQYSRTAPKKISMRDNVHIMLCDIECDRSVPVSRNPQCESFSRDLAGWHRFCGNVFLWDYDIQFTNLIAPFPNFQVLAENMKYFYENSVRSIFNQANRENRGDFWALRAYLLSKLSWNPYCDYEKHYREFLQAYYGAAAPEIDGYIKAMTEELNRSGEGLSIFGQPEQEAFLSEANCRRYGEILDGAVRKASGDAVLLARVEEVRLGLVYAMLKSGCYRSVEEREEMLGFFKRVAAEAGVEQVYEWGIPVDEFIQKVRNGDYSGK